MLRWQGGHPFADDLPELTLLGSLGWFGRRVTNDRHDVVADGLGGDAASPEARIAQVHGDAVKPRQRRDVRPKGRPALIGPGERVLEDLLGGLPVAGQPIRGAVDRRPIADEERLEGIEIIGLHPPQNLRVE